MSYDKPQYGRGGAGGRRRNHEYNDEYRREETPEQKTRSLLIKFGQVDPVEEVHRLAAQLAQQPHSIPAIVEGFRIGVTEQPFKIPFYAALLHHLYRTPSSSSLEEAEESNDVDHHHQQPQPSIAKQVLDDFWRGFQAFLDKLAWRETRFCTHFFAHLTLAGIISSSSLLALLHSFTAVLEEFGASYGRAKRAALCAAEALMIAGPALKRDVPDGVKAIRDAIEAYNDSVVGPKWIVHPNAMLFGLEDPPRPAQQEEGDITHVHELLTAVISALSSSADDDRGEQPFLTPYADYPSLSTFPGFTPFHLPSILVPPEIIQVEGLSSPDLPDSVGFATLVKKEEWPSYLLRLFDDPITPDPRTPAGYAVRMALMDIVDIYEVNRKECAMLLLEYPKWTTRGTFKPKPGVAADVQMEEGEWQLESTIIESILSAYLLLPDPTYKPVYYVSLITELCKLAPSTVGPAVGKSIRKLYGWYLGEGGLDVELTRRFGEWFSVHMSNFAFGWVWKEWIPDLALDADHPRRGFMRRAIELEVRLSYHDRIVKTLPPPMQEREALVIAPDAPGPNFEYDDPTHPHYDSAQAILDLFRGRTKAEDVIAQLDSIKHALEESSAAAAEGANGGNTDGALRSIVMQSLLHVGSRSFSHLLNALERYLVLLRTISSPSSSSSSYPASATASATGGGNKEAKMDILTAAARFWAMNPHMIGIVFDKLMQYQIADPTDVISWTFDWGWRVAALASSSTTDQGIPGVRAFEWNLVRGALDKANGRVTIATRKVGVLRKEDEDRKARVRAQTQGTTGDMEFDAVVGGGGVGGVGGASGEGGGTLEPAMGPAVPTDNPALDTAIKAYNSLVREQRAALAGVLEGFVGALASPSLKPSATPASGSVLSERDWTIRNETWKSEHWVAWETWGWYRHFCRTYSPFLRNYQATLSTVAFASLDDNPRAELVKKIWNIGIGQES